MRWKELTSRLQIQLEHEQAAMQVLRDDGRGTWVPVRPFLESDHFVSLKDLRKWLWERRTCHLLRRESLCVWGVVEKPMTYYGFAVKVDGPVLDRWKRIGGPLI